MFDDDEEVEGLQPRRWQWSAAFGAGANFFGNLGRATTALFDDLSTLAAQHAAVKYERDDLIASAQRDLESLPVDE